LKKVFHPRLRIKIKELKRKEEECQRREKEQEDFFERS
jgi:hypothetical protein